MISRIDGRGSKREELRLRGVDKQENKRSMWRCINKVYMSTAEGKKN